MVNRALMFAAFVVQISIANAILTGISNVTLFKGPRQYETGIFLFYVNGGPFYCKFCEDKALTDSTYLEMQQTKCYPSNRNSKGGKNKNNYTKYEIDNKKYAICDVGETPGCGKPPQSRPNLKWKCSKDYFNELYSVYFPCQLVCNYTEKVLSQIYCNESLVWHTDYKEDLVCTGPVIAKPNGFPFPTIIIIIVAGSVALGILLIFVCLYRRKKRSSPYPSEGDIVEQRSLDFCRGGPPRTSFISVGECSLINEPGMNTQVKHEEIFDGEQNNNIEQAEEELEEDANEDGAEEDNPNEQVGNRCDENEDDEVEEEDDENSKLIPLKAETKLERKECPEIRVFHSNMRDSRQGNLEASNRLQDNVYSLPRGSTFYIVPSSPQNIAITDFVVIRKGNGRPYRGESRPELNLNFFNIVSDADDEDAGQYIGFITLENGECFQREFQIFISPAEENSDEDKVDNSLPNISLNPDADPSAINVQIDACDSGEVSEEIKGARRMEPDGAEAEQSFVRSGKPGPGKPGPNGQNPVNPLDQIAAIQNMAQQNIAQQQNIVQSSDESRSQSEQEQSVPHLNIDDSLLDSQESQESSNQHEHNYNRELNVEGRQLSLSTLLSSHHIENDQKDIHHDNPVVRAEVSASFGNSCNTQSNQRSNNSNNEMNSGIIRPGIDIPSPLDNAPNLNPNSVCNRSYSRDDPSGSSLVIEYSEPLSIGNSEQSCRSIEDNNAVPYAEVEIEERHQTARKEINIEPARCCANLGDLQNPRYLESLCQMADPRNIYSNRRSWFGFGQRYGLLLHFLLAIEYHRRGHIDDGPMRTVLRELGSNPVYDLVDYFLEHNRQDIVDLTLDDCPEHRNCQVCLDKRDQYRQRR